MPRNVKISNKLFFLANSITLTKKSTVAKPQDMLVDQKFVQIFNNIYEFIK